MPTRHASRRQFLRRSAQFGVALALGGAGGIAGIAHAASQQRRLRFTLTFTNPFSRPLEQQAFWCYLPASLGAQQRLSRVQVSVPHQLEEDAFGHRILALNFANIAPLAQKIVSITTELELDASAAQTPLTNPAQWLTAERFIESDHAEIRAQAASLKRDTPVATAKAIYDWVQGQMQYAGYIADDLGALQALRSKRGDCTEYADLVVALARANGIAARMAGGYVTDRDYAPRPEEYHNWAELYLDGGWRVVDAQKGQWWPLNNQYLLFRIYRDATSNAVGNAHRYKMVGELQLGF